LDGSRGVDGQKYFKVLKLLPRNSDGQLELRKKIVGLYDKGKAGTVLETTTSLVDKHTGEVYTIEIGSVFFVGQGDWGGEKGPKPTIYAVPDRKADRVHKIKTTKESALLYRYVLYADLPD
jgi:peroxisomal enoyl-CoA hydratase 2